jgi:membrane fusion protein (multidrug efflux system)
MAVENSDNALVHLRTLFNVGAIGALSDRQLLERFATGRGEPRELAFAALVERHGAFVLRVCRSVLRDEHAAEDAFQATFLALARKAGSLWVQDSLAPWLHQAAYRASVHDRSASIRRRAHEQAAAAPRAEAVVLPQHGNADDIEKMIQEEIDRLPGRFRIALVLCDLEGRTHEQAASHLGCAVGTVKSRLARGRKRLRGRLVSRGVAPAAALAVTSVGDAARAAVPKRLAELTVNYAATASVVPSSIAGITEGVLRSMFLSKVKFVLKATAVVAALAAGAGALAQSGIGRSKDGTDKPQHADSPSWIYHILVSREGEPPRKVAVVEMTGDTPITVDAPGALIRFQPKHDGDADRQTAAKRRDGSIRAEVAHGKKGLSGAKSFQRDNEQEHREIVVTSAKTMDVVLSEPYVCQIHAHRHIDVRSLVTGYLQQILVKEGQAVKKGDLMFKIVPTLVRAKVDAELAELNLAQLEYDNTKKLADDRKVSQNELKLFQSKLERAKANAEMAKAELRFADIVAAFDGIIGRLQQQVGSLIKEGDALTTLSDNNTMWVYFNVPEKRYLEYPANRDELERDKIELVLANHNKFPQRGKIGAIEAQFNNQTGNIAFRADFENPDRLLRHGQTGTVLLHRVLNNAIVVPQRATYEIGDKRYVYVVDMNDVAHVREIVVNHETDDIFVIKKGVGVGERIVVEGVRKVNDGDKVEYEFRPIENVIPKSSVHAE